MEKLLIPRIEAAAVLSISASKLDELRYAGDIAYCKIGSRVYFRPQDLTRFVNYEFDEEGTK